ncbi:hypothetical protein [Minwuia sp. IMCC3060]|uniref:hypothetical protein n=1 Tax=Minwuia sp. IMCC3060 TaxID=3040675 RepID=UPI0024784669|nr:hypothetical protein [Minwuia sp. IMCC3060]
MSDKRNWTPEDIRLEQSFYNERWLRDREARRTDERERVKAGFDAAITMGIFVLKGLMVLNSGALITLAALYTSPDRNFADELGILAAMIYLIGGLMLALGAAMAGYFQGHRLQTIGTLGGEKIDISNGADRVADEATKEKMKERLAEVQSKIDLNWKRADWQMRTAVALAIFSAVLFLGGVVRAYLAL